MQIFKTSVYFFQIVFCSFFLLSIWTIIFSATLASFQNIELTFHWTESLQRSHSPEDRILNYLQDMHAHKVVSMPRHHGADMDTQCGSR